MQQTPIPTTIRGLTLRKNLPFSIPEVQDITDQLPKHATLKWGRMTYGDIKRIIVHHMASEAPLINQAKYHVNSHNWPGIAYKLCVSDGFLYQTNDLLSYTYHASGANSDSIGIAVKADYSKREMTDSERQLLYAGILTLRSIWPNAEILGHNQVSKTACPCTDMDRIRKDIAALELKIAETEHQQQEHEEYTGSQSAQRTTAYAIAERVKDLQIKLEDAKWGAAARIKLEWLLPVMDIVGGDKTAEGVAARVDKMYKTATEGGKFSEEGVRKILLFEPLMREKGLLL